MRAADVPPSGGRPGLEGGTESACSGPSRPFCAAAAALLSELPQVRRVRHGCGPPVDFGDGQRMGGHWQAGPTTRAAGLPLPRRAGAAGWLCCGFACRPAAGAQRRGATRTAGRGSCGRCFRIPEALTPTPRWRACGNGLPPSSMPESPAAPPQGERASVLRLSAVESVAVLLPGAVKVKVNVAPEQPLRRRPSAVSAQPCQYPPNTAWKPIRCQNCRRCDSSTRQFCKRPCGQSETDMVGSFHA